MNNASDSAGDLVAEFAQRLFDAEDDTAFDIVADEVVSSLERSEVEAVVALYGQKVAHEKEQAGGVRSFYPRTCLMCGGQHWTLDKVRQCIAEQSSGPDVYSLDRQIGELRSELEAARHLDRALAGEFVRAVESLRRHLESLARDRDEIERLNEESTERLQNQLNGLDVAVPVTEAELVRVSAAQERLWADEEATDGMLERVMDEAWDLLARCPRCGTRHEWYERCAPISKRAAGRWMLFEWHLWPRRLRHRCTHPAASGGALRQLMRTVSITDQQAGSGKEE